MCALDGRSAATLWAKEEEGRSGFIVYDRSPVVLFGRFDEGYMRACMCTYYTLYMTSAVE